MEQRIIRPQPDQPFSMRRTIRGLLIKDHKVLLVTGHGADFYWTPGGGVEGDETPLETLHREIQEELGVTVDSAQEYSSYIYQDQDVQNFLITISGEIHVGEEITDYAWYDSSNTLIKPSSGFTDALLPKLIKDNLIK